MDPDSLSATFQKIQKVQDELQEQETKIRDIYKDMSENPHTSEWDKPLLRNEYRNYLSDYEAAYDKANKDYQESIQGLSDAYLSMCPFYKGKSLPKATFIDSKNDICDLYALFLLMGVAHMYGISN